jgi:hypothetical protein
MAVRIETRSAKTPVKRPVMAEISFALSVASMCINTQSHKKYVCQIGWKFAVQWAKEPVLRFFFGEQENRMEKIIQLLSVEWLGIPFAIWLLTALVALFVFTLSKSKRIRIKIFGVSIDLEMPDRNRPKTPKAPPESDVKSTSTP